MNGWRMWIGVGAVALVTILTGGLSFAQDPGSQPGAAPAGLVGTGFTYQGRLTDGGGPVNGSCDFAFELYDEAGPGGTLLGTETKPGVPLDDGLFTVQLDFGGAFWGEARWLEIEVDCGSGAATLSPRQPVTPAPYALALPGLLTLENPTSPSVVGGWWGNGVASEAVGATISGGGQEGYPNTVLANFGTVGGGDDNRVNSRFATIGGGGSNDASGLVATIGGGALNSTDGEAATVGGGWGNTAVFSYATVSGGWSNEATQIYATVGGGGDNVAGERATVGGGENNAAQAPWATIGGGQDNVAGNHHTTVAGGYGNQASGLDATVAGGLENSASGDRGAVGGGWHNVASGWLATVGGGLENSAVYSYTTVSGGQGNRASGQYATVGGGLENSAVYSYTTVSGGQGNVARGYDATVGGGEKNVAHGWYAAVGGGGWNDASGRVSTIGGGAGNTANGEVATVGGGSGNRAGGAYATVGGGSDNWAGGAYATVPGGHSNQAVGDYGFAAGRQARALHPGSFVWADSTNANFASTDADQFRIRASGGAQFYVGTNSVFAEGSGGARWSATLRANNTNGSTGMAAYMTNDSDFATAHFANGGTGQVLYLENAGSDAGGTGGGDFIQAVNDPETDTQFRVTTSGQARSDVGFTTPAEDLAEMFPAVDGLEPGDVLVIGPDGLLHRSETAYDHAVVGVYSTWPGFIGGQPVDGELEDHIPLAVVGVVPVKVSAENGPIRPGDPLVAASTPGHAMKARPITVEGITFFPSGVLIGKALESFDEGTGVIRMLVTLQ